MLLFSFLFGCSINSNAIQSAKTNTVPIKEASYTLGGWVENQVCSNYVFGLRISPSGKKQYGMVSADSILGMGSVKFDDDSADALYGLLEEYPSITHLLYPRTSVEMSGLILPFGSKPIFGERCSTVRARTMTMGTGFLGESTEAAPVQKTTKTQRPTSNRNNERFSQLANQVTSKAENLSQNVQNKAIEAVESIEEVETESPTTETSTILDGYAQVHWTDVSLVNGFDVAPNESSKCIARFTVRKSGYIVDVSTSGCNYKSKNMTALESDLKRLRFRPYTQDFQVSFPVSRIK